MDRWHSTLLAEKRAVVLMRSNTKDLSLLRGPVEMALMTPPHIILYISDDHGSDFLGCYGNSAVRTPHIDQLAADGLRFRQSFTVSPTCAPSRTALHSGLYPSRNGAMRNHSACHPGLKISGQYLQDCGYRSVLMGKFHVRPVEPGTFEEIPAFAERKAGEPQKFFRQHNLDTDAIDALIAQHASEHPDQPLFLCIGDPCPHVTWATNEEFDPEALPLLPFMVDGPVTRRALANYYQDIRRLDTNVGAVRHSLQKHGLAGDSVFIYTTDHGSEWPKSKWTVYDAGIRLPMIYAWPGTIEPGRVTDAMVSHVDLLPTLNAIAGGEPMTGLDGESYLPVLRGETDQFREAIYATQSQDDNSHPIGQRAIRTERYKYIRNLPQHPGQSFNTIWMIKLVEGVPDTHALTWQESLARAESDPASKALVEKILSRPPEEFYDLDRDPYEMDNRIDDESLQEVIAQLRDSLLAWQVRVQDPGEPAPFLKVPPV